MKSWIKAHWVLAIKIMAVLGIGAGLIVVVIKTFYLSPKDYLLFRDILQCGAVFFWLIALIFCFAIID